MSFALPQALRAFIDQRVRSGEYGNTSEYLRELIRRDQELQAAKRLRELIEEGLNSGPASPLVEADIEAIKVRILAQARAKPK